MRDRYRVLQRRGGADNAEDPVVLAATRRYNGALAIRDAQADSTRAHLRSHAAPGDRVVTGPDDRGPDCVTSYLTGPNVLRWVATWVEPVQR